MNNNQETTGPTHRMGRVRHHPHPILLPPLCSLGGSLLW